MLETFISCGSCYINRYFVPTRYEKQLVKIRQYIDDRNKSVLIRSGICITDPMERGLRVVCKTEKKNMIKNKLYHFLA